MITLSILPLRAPAHGKSIWFPPFFPVSALLLILLLCGCASQSHWKNQTFALTAPAAKIAAGADAQTNLLSLRRVTISPFYADKPLVYRTDENRYERDPYAEFLVPPDEMLAECLRLYLRAGQAFGTVLEPDSGLKPSCFMEVSVSQLYGDFRQPDKPFAVLEMRLTLYSAKPAGGILWQREFSRRLPLTRRTAAALVAGWNAGLQQIMDEVNPELKPVEIQEGLPLKNGDQK